MESFLLREIIPIILLSLTVSGLATIFASLLGTPLGIVISLWDSRYKRPLISILNTWMALPAVLIGLLVYLFLSRQGPMGRAGLLFTPTAMIIAQTLLATPIVAALTLSAISSVARGIEETALSLGANRWQAIFALIREAKFALVTAYITGFARVIGETGMTLMVGGNIKNYTRVMTTAIALETMKGNFELAIVLGIILLVVALLINLVLQFVQGKGQR